MPRLPARDTIPRLRIVFFGTPEFSVPSLSRLLEEGFDVPLVVTRPDRPVGRSARPVPSPVAAFARTRDLAVSKPERVKQNPDLSLSLADASPDAAVVVAYGKILPSELLDLPRLGSINLHASLLPRHRGASPVQAAILAGDRETGVVTMRMAEELDTGPLYRERRVTVGEKESAGSLSRRLSTEGADLLVETLRGLEAGGLMPRPQEGEPTYCRPLRREDGRADWSLTSAEIERRLRAFTPWPGLYTFLGSDRVKILEAELGGGTGREPGEIWIENGNAFVAAGGGSSLNLARVQRSGKRPVAGAELLRSLPDGRARFASSPED